MAYSIHIVEESCVADGFVNMVKKHIWPEYTHKQFFWFNLFLYSFHVLSIILYETFGGHWALLPLSFSWMFVTNGLWHLLGSIAYKSYSPGLATSPLYWILMRFIIKHQQATLISRTQMISALLLGTLFTILMVASLYLGRILYRQRK